MARKKNLIVALLFALLISLGTILLIDNTGILNSWETSSIALLKQYLKIIGFLSIMGLVYLKFKNTKPANNEEIKE